ncbi:hypothetical protein ATANTOWER_029426 [Ataeniobius toweri]|uniref:Uncharacterized protein n=1 Tax=Ataeniobius toweri TaxID=208326 RepID=A0ABU7AVV8_9TELE|nr:hypothetical protein [Ataeniobius toweri]
MKIFLRRCSRHVPPGGGPRDGPGHAGGTMFLGWPGNALGSPPEELEEVSGERDVWASLLSLLPRRPGQDKAEDDAYEYKKTKKSQVVPKVKKWTVKGAHLILKREIIP